MQTLVLEYLRPRETHAYFSQEHSTLLPAPIAHPHAKYGNKQEPPSQSEYEYHRYLNGKPCDENGQCLPPNTPPTIPQRPSRSEWMPYRDCIEFETAELLYTKTQMLAGDINTLTELWRASFIKHGIDDAQIPFSDKDNLYRTIDATPIGGVPWDLFSLSYNGEVPQENAPPWMSQSFDVWYRSPQMIVHNILSNSDFKDNIDYVPYREFCANGKRKYKDFMSGNWAWKEANIIAEDQSTHGSTFVPIILGSDKTTVSVATGQNEYYPIYISIGNVHNSVCQAHQNALALLGFLSIPKISAILQDLKPAMTTPEVVRCADQHFQRVVYGIGPYIADYPEQALLACIVQGWCPRCTAAPNNLDGKAGWRSRLHTEALIKAFDRGILWDQYGLVADITPFTNNFPRVDIHKTLVPDLLHQVIKGTFKDHLVSVRIYSDIPILHRIIPLISQLVEQLACIQKVPGSIPGLVNIQF
ncbi:hypothetical protein SERLA73DRAFT_156242 [Serpula lacrymans var. lacrymans S7.3]|uniref:Uncharacterized protein n=1 Tax=Serpula lacrymans var. lacrymans (strain S7.3) TaxID=936435 RepID=F8QDL6_SERL3|nr:hypothetical protein SERLA73DRAFT_156242 [Serpula lacrymans var. lacrymans S7.3]